jgi:hypothetical protein
MFSWLTDAVRRMVADGRTAMGICLHCMYKDCSNNFGGCSCAACKLPHRASSYNIYVVGSPVDRRQLLSGVIPR